MNILVIDDDVNIRNLLENTLKEHYHQVFSADNGNTGFNIFYKEKIDLCFLDLWMPEVGGIDILKKIKDEFPNVEVVMISGEAKIDHAVKTTKIGAYDFIEKPLSVEKILEIAKSIEKINEKDHVKDKNPEKKNNPVDILIGESGPINAVKNLIDHAAVSDARILITGENGTGKEVIAREIHQKSARKNRPFVGINCAAIPESLIESELFGYKKGSFTGALEDRTGKFESANFGTLFLDEIADMSLATQSKVLRVLQEMKVTKIGASFSESIDVRIIAATNKDIKEEIKNGNFREDLYYRLNVIPINVPSLRERKEDIPLFINYFMKYYAKKSKINAKKISKQAVEYFKNYNWPGNVRQLRNIVERIYIMVPENKIDLEHVKEYLDNETANPKDETNQKYTQYKLHVAREEFEKDFIKLKLKENHYNLSKTAKALGVYPSNLSTKLNKLGVNVDDLKKE